MNMSESVRLLCYWLGLAALTLATVNLAGAEIRSGIAVAVVALAVAKAWLIIDGFMELRHASPGWRVALLAWPFAMATGVLLAYRF